MRFTLLNVGGFILLMAATAWVKDDLTNPGKAKYIISSTLFLLYGAIATVLVLKKHDDD